MVDRLFVYGTLRSPYHNPYARRLAREGVWEGSARVRGRLYDLGWHPAMRPSQGQDEWVTGEVCRLRSARRTLKVLDAYEGKDYQRVRVRAMVGDRVVPVWVYAYRKPLPDGRRLASGDYPRP